MGKRRPKGSQGKKEFNHDNILKLRSAEKHLRRNRLKVSYMLILRHLEYMKLIMLDSKLLQNAGSQGIMTKVVRQGATKFWE